MTRFDEFMREVEAEARAEGPEAEAELRSWRRLFRSVRLTKHCLRCGDVTWAENAGHPDGLCGACVQDLEATWLGRRRLWWLRLRVRVGLPPRGVRIDGALGGLGSNIDWKSVRAGRDAEADADDEARSDR